MANTITFKKPRVVITGGMGFIFSHVAEHLNARGYEVHIFDNLSAGSHEELVAPFQSAGISFYEEDVSFLPAVDKIMRLNPEYIVHAAAISDVDQSIKKPAHVLQANNNATINVFEAARKCTNLKRLLYVSTDEVYGECDHPKEEHEILFPKNSYSVSKAFGSLMRLAYDNTYPELKDKTCETRFCNVFGGRQDARKIIPAIKRALDGGQPVPLHNKGMGIRQWIHVEDIPPVIELLLEKGHRTYNITSGVAYSVLDLLHIAEEATGRAVPTVPGKRLGMDKQYLMTSKRIHEEFGWKPKLDVYDAIFTYFRS